MSFLLVALTFLHFVSVSGVVGCFLFIRFISTPIMRRLAPTDGHAVPLLIEASSRLVTPEWVFAGVGLLSGVPLMLLNRQYQGLLQVGANPWSALMTAKHGLVALLLIAMAVYTREVRRQERLMKTAGPAELDAAGGRLDLLALTCSVLGALTFLDTSLIGLSTAGIAFAALKFLHVLFVSAWIGGMFFVVFIGTPLIASHVKARSMTLVEGVGHMHMVASRFIKLLWMSMFASIFTGFPLLFLDGRYAGFLKSGDALNTTMLVKMLLFLVMILGAFEVTPAIIRLGLHLELGRKATPVPDELVERIKAERATMSHASRYGLSFSMIVLLVTAVMMVTKAR
jgi:uncharacterized membrane protein